MSRSPIPIIVVDDHQIVIDGIRALLLLHKNIKIVGTANNAEELWKLLERHSPQVVLLDRQLPTMDGIEITQKLIAEERPLHVLMLTANTDKGTIVQAVQAGVCGFLPKECRKEELIKAIEQVARGEHYFGKDIAPIVYQSFAQQMRGNKQSQPKLTNRETEVIRGFANGQTYKEIGAALFISPRTVETHKKNIYTKLGFQNQADLIKYAIREGIITL
jgi:DNA-binding NarL/FixJ family response regulator